MEKLFSFIFNYKTELIRINKYRIGFTCYSNSKLPYIVSKFFEIPGSGALLLAFVVDIEKELQELGFIDMENYISINKKNFKEKLEWLFDEKNNDEIGKVQGERKILNTILAFEDSIRTTYDTFAEEDSDTEI